MSDRFIQLLHRIEPQATLLRAWPLTGGVSAQVTAVEYVLPDGSTRKVVARQHGEADLHRNPNIAADEYRLLRFLYAAGIPVPEPVYLDTSREIFAVPVVVTAFVEGTTAPDLDPVTNIAPAMAAALARIHALDLSDADLPDLPRIEAFYPAKLANPLETPDESLSETRIRDVLRQHWPPAEHPAALLHGDFWPGNILWQGGRIAAILDWEDAALGDPLADLANARLEMLWASGIEAMEAFTRVNLRISGADAAALPVWDLCAALRPASKLGTWGLDAATESKMRALHAEFVAQAISKLAR